MASQVSPGVVVQEVDHTTIIPNVSTSIGGIVIQSTKGPVDQIVEISSENELVEIFGRPTVGNASWFSAANFLKYSGALKVVRTVDYDITVPTAVTNAQNSSGSAGIYVPNASEWETLSESPTVDDGKIWCARTPGVWGDSLKVEMCTSATSFATWAYASRFDSAPGTSEYVSDKNGANDEMHIVVIDEAGHISGIAGTVLEDFAFVSKAFDAKVNDVNNYYKDVIARSSNYIHWMGHRTFLLDGTTTISPPFGGGSSDVYMNTTEVYSLSLAGGADGDPGASDYQLSWNLFGDADTVDVSLLISGSSSSTTAQKVMDIADERKDCVAFISPERGHVVNIASSSTQTDNVKNFFDTLNSSSYSVFDSGWKKRSDPYNDTTLWIPLNSDIAGLCALTDDVSDPWFSPAGDTRGNVKSVVKLAFNPTKTQRDTLYKARINPVCTFPGRGTVLWGDKTAQKKASAFDRINVRRLFITLEKAIAKASESQLFELNDYITRANFISMVEPFLRDVQGRRGITDFKVVCDTTNNPGDVIDRNEFRGDIYIKPTRSINFIHLRFIATRTGDSFDEIGG